ncbi:MAG: lipoyl protein ligase domain-containing protein [Actinomycetota bacterium]
MKGDAGALHDRPITPVASVEVLEIDQSAVVLGSTQSFDVVDTARATELGFVVVRRRSGGGVVVLQRGDHAWIDVTVPRGHRLWSDDVERATWWLGEVWCEVLSEADPHHRWAVHQGKLVASAPERVVCFASVGPGEVVQSSDVSRKVVGVSQRRTKDAARFQCTVFREIDLALHQQLLKGGVPHSLATATGVGDLLEIVARNAVQRLTAALG